MNEHARESLVDVVSKAMLGAFVVGSFALVAAYVTAWRRAGGLPSDLAQMGQFGDFVGGTLNPLLGVLTLFALVFTLTLQARQLQYSKEELAATRAELARTASAQEDAATLMREQLKAATLAAEAQREATGLQAESAKALASQARAAAAAAEMTTLSVALAAYVQELEHAHTGSRLRSRPGEASNLVLVVNRIREAIDERTNRLLDK